MTTASTEPATGRPWRLAFVVAAALVVGLLLLALSRNLIARALARAWLKSHGVASALSVRDLSLTGLTASATLGDPAAPDLKVDEVDVRYAITGPWNGEPLEVVTRSVRLVRPQIAVRWDGKRLTYGSMTGLVRDVLSQPANPRHPPPQVIVQGGLVRLQTPYGPLAAHADAVLEAGRLQSLQGMIEPASLTRGDGVLVTDGGPVVANIVGGALKIQALAPVDHARLGRFMARDARLSLGASVPADPARGGPASLTADISAGDLGWARSAARGATLHATFDGVLHAEAGGWRASGRGRARLDAKALETAGAQAADAAADIDLPSLTLAAANRDLRLAGDGRVTASAATLRAGSAEATAVSTTVQLSGFNLRGGAAPVWTAAVTGQARAASLAAAGARLTEARLTLAGPVSDSGLDLRGRFDADGAAGPQRILTLERALATADPAYGTALRRAAGRFTVSAPDLRLTLGRQGLDLAAGAPLRLASASGAAVTVSPSGTAPLLRLAGGGASGAFDASLSGGGLPAVTLRAASWGVAGDTAQATLALKASGDAGPVHDAMVEARGSLTLAGGSAQFTLADCASLSAGSVALAGQSAGQASARLCPTGAPLLRTRGAGWSLAGRFEQAGASLAPGDVRLSRGAGRFALSGQAGGALDGAVDLTGVEARDSAADRRFNPLTAEGGLTLAAGHVAGRFRAGPAMAPRLAEITLAHDLGSGVGHADVRADRVAFAKGGLQPVSITPLAAVVRDAEGKVGFEGRFDWTPKGLTSGGQVTTAGLDFESPLGAVRGAAGTMRLTSLAPLATAPDQRLTVKSIDAVVPLADGTAAFQIDADGLSLTAADAAAAKGRISLEPMRIAFDDKAGVEGALLLSRVDLGEILAASSLADSVKVEMIVDGRLPFTLGPDGFRFLQGHITAAQPGRISIARAALTGLNTGGEGASTGPAVNAVQDLAYQALENLAFDTLEAEVASRPNGRLGMVFRIKGRFDPPRRQEAVLAISDVLSGKAFQKTIPLPSDTPINLNLDTSLNFDELVRSLSALWGQDNSAAVQPAEP